MVDEQIGPGGALWGTWTRRAKDANGLVLLIAVGVLFDVVSHFDRGVDDVDVVVDEASSYHVLVENAVDGIAGPPLRCGRVVVFFALLRFLLPLRY